MHYLLGLAFITVIVGAAVQPWHAEQAQARGEEPQTIIDAMVEARRDSIRAMEGNRARREKARQRRRNGRPSGMPAAIFDFRHLGSQNANGVSDAHRNILMSVADAKGVPAGILYGIWTNESRRLPGGWSERWSTASSLVASDSPCRRWLRARGRNAGQCDVWFQSLRRVCAQRRSDGRQVCDIGTVRVSVTFDMGPMQHNASSLCRRRSGGEYRWGPHVNDYDGDGAFDPHNLREAMSASGDYLRSEFDSCMARGGQPAIGCWGYAVNEYAGAQSSTYYQRRIFGLWHRWCATPGYCG